VTVLKGPSPRPRDGILAGHMLGTDSDFALSISPSMPLVRAVKMCERSNSYLLAFHCPTGTSNDEGEHVFEIHNR